MARHAALFLAVLVLTGCAGHQALDPYPAASAVVKWNMAPPLSLTGTGNAARVAAVGDVPLLVAGPPRDLKASADVGTLDLAGILDAELLDVRQSHGSRRLQLSGTGPLLTVQPLVVLTPADGEALLHVVLTASMKRDDGGLWQVRIQGLADERHPLDGEEGWLGAADRLRAGIEQAARRASLGLIEAVDGELPKEAPKQTVAVPLPWTSAAQAAQIEVLTNLADEAIFIVDAPNVEQVAGLHVAPASDLLALDGAGHPTQAALARRDEAAHQGIALGKLQRPPTPLPAAPPEPPHPPELASTDPGAAQGATAAQPQAAQPPAQSMLASIAQAPMPPAPATPSVEPVPGPRVTPPPAANQTLGPWSYEVDHLARAQGCSGAAAWLIGEKDGAETYQVDCDNGTVVYARCEANTCALMQ